MFGFFESKGKKAVKKWKNEHEKIVELANGIINAYTIHDEKKCKALLRDLSGLASKHVMDEDLVFFRLQRENKFTPAVSEHVKEFKETFRQTKMALMEFLTKYSRPDTPLDEEFFKEFNNLVGTLSERIRYEEENLYKEFERI